MTELEILLTRVPEPLRTAAEVRGAAYMESTISLIREFLEADKDGQACLLAFFKSDGPRVWREPDLQHQDSTPTSADLANWATDR